MTETVQSATANDDQQLSLSTSAARNLATTTKSAPQMQSISSRWLLKLLPWVQVSGGTYRVNRRLTYTLGDGRIEFTNLGAQVRVIPQELRELGVLRDLDDDDVLSALADRFVQREYSAGDVIIEAGGATDEVLIVAHGKAEKLGTGRYGDQTVLGVLADGDFLGEGALLGGDGEWDFALRAVTACTLLALPRQAAAQILDQSEALRTHLERVAAGATQAQNEFGEAEVALTAGHAGEPTLPSAFVDYESAPREYELSVAQTVLRVHSRVADLYSEPMDQIEQQLRLTIEALREAQEQELINNREFGLLHNADLKQRIHPRTGAPTPDDFDDLLATVWKDPSFFLAHPKTIAAFGRECSKRGVYPQSVPAGTSTVPAWRGVPIFPCNKIPITETRTSSVLLMRAGEQSQGVIGLHQTGIPDEYQPSLSVRFMGIDEKALINYLVSAYYSAAVLVPDALGILENVEIAQPTDSGLVSVPRPRTDPDR